MRLSASSVSLTAAPDDLRAWRDADRADVPPCAFVPDARVPRRVTFRMYPKARQLDGLRTRKRLHKDLANGALAERISAWRKAKKSVSFADQCKSLTEIRAALPEYAALNAQSEQETLKRIDRAFQGFFQRVKRGETPGFPRFKSYDRFPGWGYKTHGDGFTFEPGPNWKHGKVRIEDLGWIRLRGEARVPGEPIRADVVCKGSGDAEQWFLSLVILCDPWRDVDADRVGAAWDWGVEHALTWCVEDTDGAFRAGDLLAATVEHVPNPRFFRKTQEKAAAAQDVLNRRKKGSHGQRRARAVLSRLKRKEANRRKDFVEQQTARAVRRFHTVVTEGLNVTNMTASARGDVENPGTNVRQKAGLNASILDGCPSLLASRMACKAEEAGALNVELDVRREAPSQHCPLCRAKVKKDLDERVHHCAACGHRETRDGASARYMLGRAYGLIPAPHRGKKPSVRKRADHGTPRPASAGVGGRAGTVRAGKGAPPLAA